MIDNETFVPDLDFYTREEVEERDSVETDFGTIRVFVRTWSLSDDFEEDYYEDVEYAYVQDGKVVFTVRGYVDEIEEGGYTIESLIQTMLQN
jgi:hypothetical protein